MISGAMTLDVFGKIVTIAGTALGILGTLYAAWRYLASKRKTRERVATLLSVGDRIAETAAVEGEGYERAVAEYEKALALDRHNVEIYRRILNATRRGLELENEARLMSNESQAKVNAALRRLYEFQAGHPAQKQDRELMLEEAALLWLGSKYDSARALVTKAHERYPDDADVLAELGGMTKDAGPLQRAIAANPTHAGYHRSLAYVLRKQGRSAEAIREYRRAAELATGADLITRRSRNESLWDLMQIFRAHGDSTEGVLGAGLGMPPEERAEMLEYFLSASGSSDKVPHYYLATLYHARGDLEKAHHAIRTALGDDRRDWRHYHPRLRLLAQILEGGARDPALLAEIQAMLQQGRV